MKNTTTFPGLLLAALAAGLLVSCANFAFRNREIRVDSRYDGAAGVRESLDAALEETLAADKASMIQVFASGRRGEYEALASYGEAPPGNTGRIRFQIGSATKTFTAVLALMAVEEGRLSLDDTLDRWFPGFPGSDRVTVRMLLRHRSGFKDVFSDAGLLLESSLAPGKLWDPEEVIGRMEGKKPRARPGERFSYCNLGYILSGEILARVYGAPIGALFEERLFAPLFMRDTALVAADASGRFAAGGPRAAGIDGGFLPLGPHRIPADQLSWPSLAGSSGGCVSTAGDLAKFYRALMGGKLLPKESLAAMLDFAERENMPEARTTGYGIGFAEFTAVDGTIAWGHRGGIMGFDTTPLYFPDSGAVVVVLRNYSDMDDWRGLDLAFAAARIVE